MSRDSFCKREDPTAVLLLQPCECGDAIAVLAVKAKPLRGRSARPEAPRGAGLWFNMSFGERSRPEGRVGHQRAWTALCHADETQSSRRDRSAAKDRRSLLTAARRRGPPDQKRRNDAPLHETAPFGRRFRAFRPISSRQMHAFTRRFRAIRP